MSSQPLTIQAIQRENRHVANKCVPIYDHRHSIPTNNHHSTSSYHPLLNRAPRNSPVVFERAQGALVWDVDGKRYIDCLSAYSAVNQGHCHPNIVKALTDQASKLTLSSRAFHSDMLGKFAEKLTSLLGYERVLPMNTGAEAVETAIKLARKWAYTVKKVPKDKAIVLSCTDNFHGRTIGVISMSTDPDCREGFGPFLDRVGPTCPSTGQSIRFNHIEDLEAALETHGPEVAAFLVEPIQGEAGIIIPDEDYLEKVQALCRKHNVLLICDEIQTGFGRTGKMLCHQHNPRVKADIITLGKALSGGVFPVSAVMADSHIMNVIQPGSHGSTYGGNPLAAAVSIAALDVLVQENLCERAEKLGSLFRSQLEQLKTLGVDDQGNNGWVTHVRGKGLLNAIVINPTKSVKGYKAWHVCLLMKEKGLLAKPTHENIIRLAPPLVIEEADLTKAVETIRESLLELDTRDHIEDLSAHE